MAGLDSTQCSAPRESAADTCSTAVTSTVHSILLGVQKLVGRSELEIGKGEGMVCHIIMMHLFHR